MKAFKFGITLLLCFALFLPYAISEEPQDGLSVAINSADFSETWEGKADEGYQWYIVCVTISNWSTTTFALSESVQCQLVGQGAYRIDAENDFDTSTIDPFTKISGRFVFKVPDLIVDGQGGPLKLELNSNGIISTQLVIDAPQTEGEGLSQVGADGQVKVSAELSDPPNGECRNKSRVMNG